MKESNLSELRELIEYLPLRARSYVLYFLQNN